MSDYKDPLRSHWVEDLETDEIRTELPYHLAAWDYLKRKSPPMNAVTAEQMEPSNWLAEVETAEGLQDEKARQEAENSEKKRLAELEKRREVLPLKHLIPKECGSRYLEV